MSVSPSRRAFTLAGLAAPLGAALAAAPASAQSPRRPAAASRADAVAKALYAANPTPALSLAVARASGVVWTGVFGKADLEFDLPTTPEHRFRMGSVSKVLTTTTAAKLISRGLITLDAPISTWLPDLPAAHRQTTLRQLFTHQGGVRHYTPKDSDKVSPTGGIDVRTYPTNKDILAVFIDDPLIGPVGSQIAYSTFGFTLASLVMEAAAKQAFPELVKSQIGEGFGLKSLVEDDPIGIRPMRASGYNQAKDMRPMYPQLPDGWANARQTNPAYKWAGGGFLMTPSDLARFGAALLDSPASKITAQERGLLFTPITQATKNMPPLGLAWRVDADAKGRRRWNHAGAQEGGRASIVIYPDLGLSIAFASNVATVPGDVLKPSSDLADAFA